MWPRVVRHHIGKARKNLSSRSGCCSAAENAGNGSFDPLDGGAKHRTNSSAAPGKKAVQNRSLFGVVLHHHASREPETNDRVLDCLEEPLKTGKAPGPSALTKLSASSLSPQMRRNDLKCSTSVENGIG